jgi:hypothetical protein
MTKVNRWAVAVFIFISSSVTAQENADKEIKEEGLKGTHRLSIVLGHSHVSEGIKDNGKKGWKVIPSSGIDYDYWIGNRWALGLHNDVMIETFEVEDHGNTVLERSKPFSSVAVAIFKPKKVVSFLAGMGGEFAKEENFAVTRVGIEMGWEMKSNWEFGISLLYDIKWNAYDTWVFGFGISKLLRKHNE